MVDRLMSRRIGAYLEHVGIALTPSRWDSTIAFYETILGMRRVIEHSGGSFIFMYGGEGALLEFFRLDHDEPIPSPNHLAFVVRIEDWGDMLSTLARAGVTVEEHHLSETGATYAFFTDVAGNRCQILRRPAPLIPGGER